MTSPKPTSLPNYQDYATCGTTKLHADASFRVCAQQISPNSNSLSEVEVEYLPRWWLLNTNVVELGARSGSLSAALDCATYTKLQQANCQCSAPASPPSLPQLAAAGRHLPLAPIQGLMPTGISMSCLSDAVGDQADYGVPSHSADLRAVASRLHDLGDAHTSAPERAPERTH